MPSIVPYIGQKSPSHNSFPHDCLCCLLIIGKVLFDRSYAIFPTKNCIPFGCTIGKVTMYQLINDFDDQITECGERGRLWQWSTAF